MIRLAKNLHVPETRRAQRSHMAPRHSEHRLFKPLWIVTNGLAEHVALCIGMYRAGPRHMTPCSVGLEAANCLQSDQSSHPLFSLITYLPQKNKKKKQTQKKGSALASKQKVSILPKTANLQPTTIPTDISLGTPKPGLTCPPSGVSSP